MFITVAILAQEAFWVFQLGYSSFAFGAFQMDFTTWPMPVVVIPRPNCSDHSTNVSRLLALMELIISYCIWVTQAKKDTAGSLKKDTAGSLKKDTAGCLKDTAGCLKDTAGCLGTAGSLMRFEEYKSASLEARDSFVQTYISLFGWMTKKGVNIIFTCVLNNKPEFSSFTDHEIIYSQISLAYGKFLDTLTLLHTDDNKALKKLYRSSEAQTIMETRGLVNTNHLCLSLTAHYDSLNAPVMVRWE